MREICAQTLYFEEEFPEEPGDWGRDEREVKEPRTPEPGSVILTGAEKEASEGRNFVPEHFYRPARQKGTLRRVRYYEKLCLRRKNERKGRSRLSALRI